ncbi:hypothetical protein [Noviluteimonas dokdonensis]|uniref:hypothetical protein n=1 Tax=Noviluteimonas dokdonensis TaxID=414050 RepID=UPI00137856FD|nr:hypothetical protein [Lysobacter dokdonensis]
MGTNWKLNAHAPRFGHWGRIPLIGLKLEWMRAADDVGGWVSLQAALLGFSASLTWWRA